MHHTNTHFWDQLAIKSYRSILKAKPGSALIHNNLGLAYVRVGNLAQAARSFRKAIRCDREYADPHYHLGTTEELMGNPDKALKHFKEFRRLTQEDPEVVEQILKRLERSDPAF